MSNKSRYRSIMAKLNFGHPLTASDKAFIKDHPELDWGPQSGYDKPNKRKVAPRRRSALKEAISMVKEENERLNEVATDLLNTFGLGLTKFGKPAPTRKQIEQ